MVASLGNWFGEWVFSGGGWSRLLLLLVLIVGLLPGCSVRQMAINKAGDALASSGTTFAADDDPELIRDAAPFSLKLMESLLAENPRHRGLLYATSSGFTQYAYAFVHQDADRLEDHDLAAASEQRSRAQKMYRRARDYGLRGLEVAHPEFTRKLPLDPKSAVSTARKDDVPLLYWTAVSWAALISLSKHDPDLVADVPAVEALIDRAAALDEAYDSGAIHNFLITYEMVRQGGSGDPAARARYHFDRAVSLTGGLQAGPYVSLAESVAVPRQGRSEFEALLRQALTIKPDHRPEWRLANTVMQRRARWLLGQTDQLFAE